VSDLELEEFSARPQTAGALAEPAETLHQSVTCGEAFIWLLRNPRVPAVAVLDDYGRVKGLVNRPAMPGNIRPNSIAASRSSSSPIPIP
jgi:hypothetical protein